MALLRPRPEGFQPKPRTHKLPKSNPSAVDVVLFALRRRLADGPIGRFVRYATERNVYIVGGNASKCVISDTATLQNTHINATSGRVVLMDWVMLAPGVSLVAGTHDFNKIGSERRSAIPTSGCDIVIEPGVFIGTNSIVVGPCHIGANSVIGAGSVVTSDIPPGVIAAGVPAKVVKTLNLPKA